MLITWLLLRGARESATANTIMVVIKLLVLALFIGVGVDEHQPGQLHAVCAERVHRHPSGRGDRVLRLHRLRRDLDGGRGNAEPAAQPADRHPRRAGGLHADLRRRRRRDYRHGAVHRARRRRSAGARARADRLLPASARSSRSARSISMSAVLLVFQYGQPRIFFAMARDGLLPRVGGARRPEDAHSVHRDAGHRHPRRRGVDGRRRGRDLRPDQHRDAVRVRAGLRRASSCCASRSPTVRGRSRCRSSGSSPRWASPPACSSWSGLPHQAWERFGSGSSIGIVALRRSTATGTASCGLEVG